MTEFEFVDDLPPKKTRPAMSRRVTGDAMDRFAATLQCSPGRWAKWPWPLAPDQTGSYTARIRRGTLRAFPHGFDALSRNGVVYVRYVGDEEDAL